VTYEYSEYQLVDGAQVPCQVTVRLGERVWRELVVSNVNLEAHFSDNEFLSADKGARLP